MMNLDFSTISLEVVLLISFGVVIFSVIVCLTRSPIQFLENTQTKLVFRIRPIILLPFAACLVGIGIFFIGVGLVTASPVVTLTCDRPALTASPVPLDPSISSSSGPLDCELKECSLLGSVTTLTSFSDLQGATIESVISDSARDIEPALQIMLMRSDTVIPFGQFVFHLKQDASHLEQLVAQINTFVDTPLISSLTVQDENRSAIYLIVGIGVCFWLLSVVLINVFPTTICQFDRDSLQFTLERYRYFGRILSTRIQHSIRHISKAEVEHSGDGAGIMTSRIILHLESAQTLALTPYSDSLGGKHNAVTTINQFLK